MPEKAAWQVASCFAITLPNIPWACLGLLWAALQLMAPSSAAAQPGAQAERVRMRRAQRLVEAGQRHQRAGDLGSAIGYYREAVGAWTRGVRAYARLGEAYLERADYGDALAAFDAGLARHPDALSLLLGRAKALESLERSGEAAISLRRATRRHPESGVALRARASLAQRRGAWLEALFVWRALLERVGAGDAATRAECRAAIAALRRLNLGMDPAQPRAARGDPVLRALRAAEP